MSQTPRLLLITSLNVPYLLISYFCEESWIYHMFTVYLPS